MKPYIAPQYDYPCLSRNEVNGKRHYGNDLYSPVPSVTTILDKTADKSHLIKWQQRIGIDEAKRQTQQAAGIGTIVHNAIEKYVIGEPHAITGNNMVHIMARQMFEKLVTSGLEHVDEIWGLECTLIAPDLYAGTADCVGIYKGKPSIIDYKTSKKIKPKEWIGDYFLQCSAYLLCHNEMFGTEIDQIVILMVDREANFQEYLVSGTELDEYKIKWMDKVKFYYGMS